MSDFTQLLETTDPALLRDLLQRMPDEIRAKLSRQDKLAVLDLLANIEERLRRDHIQQARASLLGFAHNIYPGFKEGPQHRVMSKVFSEVIAGKKKRVIINIAPRHSKSEFTSYLLPAYYLGNFPDRKVIMATHTASLSESFGRRVRNLIQSGEYNNIFSQTTIASDQRASGQWSTTAEGQYYAVGVGGALAGRGADLLVIDDPHSEQDVRTNSKETFEAAWTWYQTGPLQRLQPNGAVIVVMTRWDARDLTGMLIDQYVKDDTGLVPPWEVIELPAILDEDNEKARPLWPEMWPLAELLSKKAGMQLRYWAAQYQQRPTSDEGALIRREWWRTWEKEEPPACKFVIQSWDTAYLKSEAADFSACTTWGVFETVGKNGEAVNNIILLNAFKDRMEFPELKKVAKKHYDEWEPDNCLIEAKAAGLPLIQELQQMNMSVTAVSQSRGTRLQSNDKVARVNAVSEIFESGLVWAPDKSWARAVIEECAAFPNGDNDDYVDTVTQAMRRFRVGKFIRLPSDREPVKAVKRYSAGRGPYRVT